MLTEQQQRVELINQIAPWWKKNGWSVRTLEKKTLKQLLGIKYRMVNTTQKSTVTRHNGQMEWIF